MLYVIKTKEGAFVEQNTMNSKELNYCWGALDSVQKYTKPELNILKERFKGTWREKEFKVFKVIFSIVEI